MCWAYGFVRNQNELRLISLVGIRGWPLLLGTAWPLQSPQLSKSKMSASKYTCGISFDVMYAAFVRCHAFHFLIAFMY